MTFPRPQVAPLGSLTVAWAAKELKARVLALATTDSIECSYKDKSPAMEPCSANELVGAWKEAGAANYPGLDVFVGKVLADDTASVNAVFPASEIVPAKFVTSWIST